MQIKNIFTFLSACCLGYDSSNVITKPCNYYIFFDMPSFLRMYWITHYAYRVYNNTPTITSLSQFFVVFSYFTYLFEMFPILNSAHSYCAIYSPSNLSKSFDRSAS